MPSGAVSLSFSGSPRPVREFVREALLGTGLPPDRAADLVVATNEAATNSILHTLTHGGVVRVWHDDCEVVCEVADTGTVSSQLGDDPPSPAVPDAVDGGRGLWLMARLCDEVELRSDASATVIRLHMRLARTGDPF